MQELKSYAVSIQQKTGVLLLVLLFCSLTYAQQPAANFWDNVKYGGGVGLYFGNGSFNGSIAPSALYQVNQDFMVGPGLSFGYLKDDNYHAIIYGGSLTSLYNVLDFLQLSAELEQINVNQHYEYYNNNYEYSFWNTALFIGVGYRSGASTFGIKYNLLNDDNDRVYADAFQPFFRVYF